jgi:N utilization substance protein A
LEEKKMARNTRKKQPEAHKIDCAEIFASLRDLEKIKGIPVEYMVERMKQGMANAYRKDREDRRDVPADNVVVDLSENGLYVHVVKTVVEELEDTALEIHIDAARNINPDAQVGDTLNFSTSTGMFRVSSTCALGLMLRAASMWISRAVSSSSSTTVLTT